MIARLFKLMERYGYMVDLQQALSIVWWLAYEYKNKMRNYATVAN